MNNIILNLVRRSSTMNDLTQPLVVLAKQLANKEVNFFIILKLPYLFYWLSGKTSIL